MRAIAFATLFASLIVAAYAATSFVLILREGDPSGHVIHPAEGPDVYMPTHPAPGCTICTGTRNAPIALTFSRTRGMETRGSH